MSRRHVLVVTDDIALLETLVTFLNTQGLCTDGLTSVAGLPAWRETHDVDTVVIDLDIAALGSDWLEQQTHWLQPLSVIALSKHETPQLRIRAVRAGANNYLKKPCDKTELYHLIENLAARRLAKNLMVPQWKLDLVTSRLVAPNQCDVKVTPLQKQLLIALGQKPGTLCTKAEMAAAIGQAVEHYDMRRLEVLMRRLRNKVSAQTGLILPVDTVHGRGYCLTAVLIMEEAF
ncbi:response regulator [Halomonas sp. CH40]